MADNLVIESPLKTWPGSIELPNPDEFNGLQWQIWKGAVSGAGRKSYALTHLHCYAGLELVKKAGAWNIDGVTLEEVQGWAKNPEDERVRLVSWLGKTLMDYMNDIMDPKG